MFNPMLGKLSDLEGEMNWLDFVGDFEELNNRFGCFLDGDNVYDEMEDFLTRRGDDKDPSPTAHLSSLIVR